MQPRTRIGLIVGVIGLVLNICVAGFIGFCGPVLSLVAGGIAGYFATQQEKPFTKNQAARIGATAGGIAGGLIILGQIIGGIGALAFMQSSGATPPFGQLPDFGDPATQVGFYAGGIGTALCFGVIGALLAAGTGALAGYLTTSDQSMTPPPQNPMS
ncbi:MAG TPA: hypothetical protein VFG81_01615 [Anaerolineales bacterium]|jgi:hypothetical protein|nr:hypothetical protein [Anaerolineales bacterium]